MTSNTTSNRSLTELQQAELDALDALADTSIDTRDIPEITDERWALARRGKHYRFAQRSAATRPK
ncbi:MULTISPECIES: hypothetical protein [unclassified Rhizobium]|jgi:hypothetical protein|uniref:hypothetical protein n=1 Tax=unclassified Rhizobium TaxID=2613769 RepID=UPI00184B7466|nr:hypothetical protein [Rhizobium sp. UBA1881]